MDSTERVSCEGPGTTDSGVTCYQPRPRLRVSGGLDPGQRSSRSPGHLAPAQPMNEKLLRPSGRPPHWHRTLHSSRPTPPPLFLPKLIKLIYILLPVRDQASIRHQEARREVPTQSGGCHDVSVSIYPHPQYCEILHITISPYHHIPYPTLSHAHF